MARRRRALLSSALIAIVGLLTATIAWNAAGADVRYTTGADATVSGNTVSIQSHFANPNLNNTSFLVDTEVWNSSNQMVAQWYHNQTITKNSTYTNNLSWDISNVADGEYTIHQGLFRPNWSTTIDFEENAGTIQIGAPASNDWDLTATATVSGGVITTVSHFTAPAAGTYLLSTQIWDASDDHAAEWLETQTVTANQTKTFTYNTSTLPNGTYTVHQGVFSTDWSET